MKIIIPGKPIAKISAKPRGNQRMYNPQKSIMDTVKMQLKIQWKGKPLQGAVELCIVFYMPIPKSDSEKKKSLKETGKILHIIKPDQDNLQKLIKDCMSGIVYKDDCQVYKAEIYKRYSRNPRTEIIVKGVLADGTV